MICAECGFEMMEDDNGVSYHLNEDGTIDHEMDDDHAAICDLAYPDFEPDDFMSDAEADADVLKSAGMGTDEDYGLFGGFDSPWEE